MTNHHTFVIVVFSKERRKKVTKTSCKDECIYCDIRNQGSEEELLANPAHLLDTFWLNLDAEEGYESISSDITVEVDPGETAHYYYSTGLWSARAIGDFGSKFTVNSGNSVKGAMYGGIQTNGSRYGTDQLGQKRMGKMAIFSIWDSPGGIAAEDGWITRFGGEGTGYSVRITYDWQEGVTYKLRFYLEGTEEDLNVWSASLTDLETEKTTLIGSLYLPIPFGNLRTPKTFHERYEGSSKTIGQIEPSVVSFKNVCTNDGGVKALDTKTFHEMTVPEFPDLIWHKKLKDGVISGIAINM